ncbi:MAG: hypothetical protein CM1200mP12_19970 [Gammaproteobacteria bacterium]|nr:MAG: hypothetical protein CM1200mP12_19970 [Gammaproteobacteria bacterium]
MASANEILGSKTLQEQTFIHAHGTGTPANRTSESHILDKVAKGLWN